MDEDEEIRKFIEVMRRQRKPGKKYLASHPNPREAHDEAVESKDNGSNS